MRKSATPAIACLNRNLPLAFAAAKKLLNTERLKLCGADSLRFFDCELGLFTTKIGSLFDDELRLFDEDFGLFGTDDDCPDDVLNLLEGRSFSESVFND